MNYYDDEKNVNHYLQMAKGYDGQELINLLRHYLPAGSTVLELGMGPGKDLKILAETYQVTGSDRSAIFIERYRQQYPNADLLQLDAQTLDSDRRWDAIYSNKVLHHLTRDQLRQSFEQQAGRLNDAGLLCHSFWLGEEEYDMHGLHFVYYTPAMLELLLPDNLEIILQQNAQEMEPEDTLYIIMRKKQDDIVPF